MRRTAITRATILGTAVGAILLALPPARAVAPVNPAALVPLSEPDMMRIGESGCEFAFNDARERTYVYSNNRNFLYRTATGVGRCTFDPERLEAFAAGAGSITCAGRTLTLRKTGRVTSHAEADSASFPARLTVVRGKATFMVRGEAGTAC